MVIIRVVSFSDLTHLRLLQCDAWVLSDMQMKVMTAKTDNKEMIPPTFSL